MEKRSFYVAFNIGVMAGESFCIRRKQRALKRGRHKKVAANWRRLTLKRGLNSTTDQIKSQTPETLGFWVSGLQFI